LPALVGSGVVSTIASPGCRMKRAFIWALALC
jgi:hypothetical protein